MDTLLAILGWALFGLIVGAIARLLVPGRQPIGIGMTIVLGIVGSLLGGLATWLFWPDQPYHPAGFLGAVIGAVIVLAVYIAATKPRYGRTYP
jgi:uncharacterized membrane protein YeaQ/YmgE (transglycosylase-associated protein family)